MVRRPALVPFRWEGHGLDIRAHVTTDGDLYLVAADVCEALEIDVDVESDPITAQLMHRWPGKTYIPGTFIDDDTGPRTIFTEFYTTQEALALAGNHPSHLTADFTKWLAEISAQLNTSVLERIVDDTNRPESPYAAANYSVARAARMLSRDPALDYGQTSLFETMSRHLNWTERVDGIWVPRPEPVKAGYLFQQARRVPGRKQLYPQVRITRAGLLELHRRLGGVATLTLDDTPPLTLVEI